MDIHNREFKRATIRGYKEDEVDEFLDRIVADYEKILRENEKLKEQASLNEKEIAQFRKLEKNLQDTLMVAQSTAEEVISSAKKNADEMRANTQRECQNIREQAQIEARRKIDDATSKMRGIVAEYDRLVRDKNAFLLKIRTALESELAVTTQLLNSIPHPDESDSIPVASNPVTQPQPQAQPQPQSQTQTQTQTQTQPQPPTTPSTIPSTATMVIKKVQLNENEK